MNNKIKLIIDTDIGGDPDDMFALLLALNNPGIDILAIVTGDEFKYNYRAKFVSQILELMNKSDIRVYSGKDFGNREDFVIENLLDNNNSIVSRFNGVEIKKIIDFETGSGNKIYYLGLQALTNLAELLKIDSILAYKLIVYQMGGAVNYRHKNRAEHNFRIDPKSAKFVVESGININLVTSDTTFHPNLTSISQKNEIYRKISGSPSKIYQLLKKHCDIFFRKKYPETILSDPITYFSILQPKLVNFYPNKVKISNKGIMTLDKYGDMINLSNTNINGRQLMQLVSQGLFYKEY
jgi:pyrimidine-specific ribonucleoside hydrolase